MVAMTAQTMADEIRRQLNLSRSITALQATVSSGKKLTLPSQDPQAWVQVSEIGRAQAQQSAWQANVDFGISRAQKAEANLNEMNTLYSRARELMISASTGTLDAAGKAAIATDLQTIRVTLADFLEEKDYQGIPVFDDTVTIAIPISRGISLEAVGTRQSIADGVDLGAAGISTLDAILGQAITAIQSGTDADRAAALTAVEKGLDHVVLNQSVQGIRSDRLSKAKESLTDVDLNLAERRSKLEDTDLTAAISTIQAQLLTLEAAQAAFARINQKSLFDLIG